MNYVMTSKRREAYDGRPTSSLGFSLREFFKMPFRAIESGHWPHSGENRDRSPGLGFRWQDVREEKREKSIPHI